VVVAGAAVSAAMTDAQLFSGVTIQITAGCPVATVPFELAPPVLQLTFIVGAGCVCACTV